MDDYGDSINSSKKTKKIAERKKNQKQLEIAWKALEMMERFSSLENTL